MSGELIRPTTSGLLVPALIADEGDQAARRFLEYFTANIRNKNTRAAYVHAVAEFTRWCELRGLTLKTIEPILVAAYVEQLQQRLAAPSVKQHLAAIRMLFDWLVTGQVIPMNPASSVKGPKHVVKKGKTHVLSTDDARTLLAQNDPLGPFRMHDQGDFLDVEDDVRDVLPHPGDRGEFMKHAVDLYRGHRSSLQRRQQHPTQRIAQRHAEAALERLGHQRRHATAVAPLRHLELLRLDELLPVPVIHHFTIL